MNETVAVTESCTIDPSHYSWDTSNDLGILFPLSFKVGLAIGIHLCVFIWQSKYALRKAMAKIPFIIQLSWLITTITYICGLYQWRQYGDWAYYWWNAISSLFDIITKILVMYFICIRITVMGKFQSRLIKVGGYVLFISGVILTLVGCCIGWLSPFLPSGPSGEVDGFAEVYAFTDVYISCIEVVSLVVFIRQKFDTKSTAEFFGVIKQMNLLNMVLVIFLSAIFSLVSFYTMVANYDYDYLFNGIVATVKYAYCCEFVFTVFEKTSGSKKVKSATASHQSSQIKSMATQ